MRRRRMRVPKPGVGGEGGDRPFGPPRHRAAPGPQHAVWRRVRARPRRRSGPRRGPSAATNASDVRGRCSMRERFAIAEARPPRGVDDGGEEARGVGGGRRQHGRGCHCSPGRDGHPARAGACQDPRDPCIVLTFKGGSPRVQKAAGTSPLVQNSRVGRTAVFITLFS